MDVLRNSIGPLLIVLTLGCATSSEERETAAAKPISPPPAGPVELEPPVPEPPGPVYDAAELTAHIHEAYRYPPTACRLRALLGEDVFARLEQSGGYYPNDLDEGGEGVSYYGRTCPQPYCESALTWIHPDGGMVVAILEAGGDALLFTNRPELRRTPPRAIERYLESEANAEMGIGAGALRWSAPDHPLDDPLVCGEPEVEDRRLRFLAVADKRVCDPEFSSFWTPAAVMPASGDRAHFFDEPNEDGRREAYVIAGDLVELGWDHADDPGYVCAAFVSLAGRRTAGWLRRDALIELPHVGDPPARAELDRFVTGPTPGWLDLGAPALRLGDLSVRRAASARVEVSLESVMAGHICTMRGRLKFDGPRVLVEHDTGCGAAAVVFNNGVYLWEDGSCSGARATCTGGYVPRASS